MWDGPLAIHIFRVGESSLFGRLASLMGSFAVVTLIAAGRRKALTLGLATSHAVMPNYRKPDAWQDRADTALYGLKQPGVDDVLQSG